MEVTKEHIRHIIVYEFQKGNNASESARNIQSIYGKSVASEWMCRRWFEKFRNGNFNLKDDPRAGRPDELNDELLINTVEQNPSVTMRELSLKLNVSHMTIHRHLKRLGKDTRNKKILSLS